MIEVENLSHRFGATRALEDVGLSVRSGEVVGLVGPNGAGKTTLMRAISTLLVPLGGRVRVDGHDAIRDARAVRSLVGYLPERASLYPDLLAWEYLDLFAEIAGHGRAERARRVAESLDVAGLTDRRDALTRELSKGLRQRLALQATLLHDPKALVLDEPTDGLDPESRDQVLAQVRNLADGGRAVLLSSHVLDEIEQVADRTVILVAGRVALQPASPSRRFAIRVRGAIEEARQAIAGHKDLAAATVQGEQLVVELAEGVADAAAMVAALCAAGIAIVEVVEHDQGLREQFRRAVHPPSRSGGGPP